MTDLPDRKKTTLIEIEVRPSMVYVRLIGPQVGQRESPIIGQEVDPYLRAAGKSLRHFIMDLSNVSFMSSMGLGVAISMRNKAHAAGAVSVLYGTSPDLVRLFAMTKMDRMFKFAKDQTELDLLLKG